jgi:hypothetical protein
MEEGLLYYFIFTILCIPFFVLFALAFNYAETKGWLN